MATRIIIEEFRGPIGNKLIGFPEGKIVVDPDYDTAALEAAGVRMVQPTQALLDAVEQGAKGPGHVLAAMAQLLWGDTFP